MGSRHGKECGICNNVRFVCFVSEQKVKNNALPDEDKSEDGDDVADIHESTDVEHSLPELMSVDEEENVAEFISEIQATDESSSTSKSPNHAISACSWFPRFGYLVYLLCLVYLFLYSTVDSFLNAGSGFFLDRSLYRRPPDDCQLGFLRIAHPGRWHLWMEISPTISRTKKCAFSRNRMHLSYRKASM